MERWSPSLENKIVTNNVCIVMEKPNFGWYYARSRTDSDTAMIGITRTGCRNYRLLEIIQLKFLIRKMELI